MKDSSSNRVTAAVADEAPVPSRVTSPWTSSLPPPSRSPASGRPAGTRPRSGGATSNPPGGSRTHGEEVSEGRALPPRQRVTTRHDQQRLAGDWSTLERA